MESGAFDESRLRHPAERPLFFAFAGLNLIIAAAAIYLAIAVPVWIESQPYVRKHLEDIQALALVAVLTPVHVVILRNRRYAYEKGSSVRISRAQIAWLHEILRSQCERLGIEQIPELYASDETLTSTSYAYSSWRRDYIALGAHFIRPGFEEMKDVLAFEIGRQLGRIRLGHTKWWDELLLAYVTPMPSVMNPLRVARTYSHDRYAAYLAPVGITGLLAHAAGPHMFREVNVPEYLRQAQRYGGFWARMTVFSKDAPPVAFRIQALHKAGLLRLEDDARDANVRPSQS